MNVRIFLIVITALFSATVFGKGKPVPAAPSPPAVLINSAQVDWLNEKIIIKGANFSDATTVTLADRIEPSATIASQTADQLEIPFDLVITGIPKGNHKLVVNDAPSSSTSSISLFVKAKIIDQDLTGCPCDTEWSTELGALWGDQVTECTEIASGAKNPVEIAGIVLSDPSNPAGYPHYPIGAAFTAEPNDSVCQLTQVNNSAPLVTDLVKIRINRVQQGACRAVLASNVCGSITSVP